MSAKVALALVLGGVFVLAWDAWRAPALEAGSELPADVDDVDDDGTVDDDEEHDCLHEGSEGLPPA